MGVMARGKAQRGEGLAKTGMFLGIAGIALSILITVLAFAGISFLQKKGPEWQQQMEQKAQEMERAANEAATEAGTAAPTTSEVP